ncbi:MAG TPA: HAMP domain-containing sensor histidine kinase, partial [Verrucomicrobiae bacterium]|nr:HAMP domain-containing sensor histidine kinase [Verrucomicrobiae bacterium]
MGWFPELELASEPGMVRTNRAGGVSFPSEKLRAEVADWERDYPGLEFANLAVPRCEALTDGRQISLPDFPDAPVPPKWFTGLSPEQKRLWENWRATLAANSTAGTFRPTPTWEAFVKTDPPKEAIWVAPLVARDQAQPLVGVRGPARTETGMPFGALGCYESLSARNANLTDYLMAAIWREVIKQPSFFAPTLLDLADTLTNRADAVTRDNIFYMRHLWNRRAQQREWLDPLRCAPSFKSLKPGSAWTGGTEEALALMAVPTNYKSDQTDWNGVPLIGIQRMITFVPKPVIEAVFRRALDEKRYLIPEFATVALSLAGKPILAKGGPDQKPLLAGASGGFGVWGAGADFRLDFNLASRELMLASERRRTLRFGVLIAVAAVAAIAGFLAAYRAFRRQLRLSDMKSNFVSSVSHELRAPIASVRLMAEGLERGKIKEPEKQSEYFRFIVQECRRLSSLIENVLDFSRIEQGRKQYEFESADMVALAQKTVKLMETYAAERQIAISLQVAGEPAPMEMDGKAMQQALINLIDNAIKHSPKGSRIEVGLEFPAAADEPAQKLSAPAAVRLWVEDRGEGIPAEEHER